MKNMILEILYIISGIVIFTSGIYAYKNKENPKRIGSALFWFILGTIFVFGNYIPSYIVGILLVILGFLTITKNVSLIALKPSSDEYRDKMEKKIGNKLFIPALSIGIITLLISQFTNLGGLIALGIGSLSSLIITLMFTRDKVKEIPYESSRMLQQMGPSVILPQLLAALGGLFAYAGVGNVISDIMSFIIPENSRLFGVIGYCVSMAIFTMVMGNAFAAFAVITAGIGVPFVIALGGNPVVVGALGLTAGFCGTLMTPMAANFNMIPASVLEMKNKNGVIISQIPIAIILLISHIILMYFWAFR